MIRAPQARSPSTAIGHPRRARRLLLVAACTLAFALFAWWLDRRMLGVAREAYFGWFVLANALPGLVVAGALMALTRRAGFSFLLVAALQSLVYQASMLKLAVLGEPVGLQDLYFVTTFDPATLSLLGKYMEHPLAVAAWSAAVVLLLAVAWRLEQPIFRALRWGQALLLLASAAMLASLACAMAPWDRIYRSQTLRPSRYSSLGAVLHGGLMSSIVYAHVRNVHSVRTVDIAALQATLHAVGKDRQAASAGVKPDIVVILSESFFDARSMKGMSALPDPIPNVRAAIDAGHGGLMRVPTFGGGTIRTEFEVLTGMPMSAFPDAQFPYVTLVRERIPSLVSELEHHGYRTVAIHGNAGSFWNRQNAYRALGFDRFITEREFPANARRDGRWIADSAMTDMILRELDPAGPPKLVVALSIEAHGPYGGSTTADPAGRDAIPLPPGLSDKQALELRNYLYHVRNADAEFGRLMKALGTHRPTVVLFFGDHLPGLRDVFATLGFEDQVPATRQPVPWVLLRNDMSTPVDAPGVVESWMLPGATLQFSGLGGDRYFQLTRQVARKGAHAAPAVRGMLRRGLDAAAVARLDKKFEPLALRAAPGPSK